MKENAMNKLVIERNYLPEIFDIDLLELSKDGFPILSSFILKELKIREIFTVLDGNIVNFYDINSIKEFLQDEIKALVNINQLFQTRNQEESMYGYEKKEEEKVSKKEQIIKVYLFNEQFSDFE